jgi:hypothetical protein
MTDESGQALEHGEDQIEPNADERRPQPSFDHLFWRLCFAHEGDPFVTGS